MARKGLLDTVMASSGTKAPTPPSNLKRGAIGAVSESFEALKRRALMELDTDLIDAGGLQDRLSPEEGVEELAASIREHGQQVPILVRPSPDAENRYEVVYGRRRVAAIRLLNADEGAEPVKVQAMLRDLDLQGLIVAQGQENATRKDLTFIERAYFAAQMRELGFDRKVMGDALNVDRSGVSRLLKVVDKVPENLIEAIGSAPSAGRPRWEKLAEKMGRRDMTPYALGETSDERFDAVWKELNKKAPKGKATKPKPLTTSDGRALGTVSRGEDKAVLTLDTKTAPGFDEWLANNLARLLDDWQDSQDVEP